MADVVFFPDNKLGATVEPIFNGHTAILTQDTDRLIDGQYALAELSAFKHDLQLSSFLNPFGAHRFPPSNNENVNYGETLLKVGGTDRISFGIYWRSDNWLNPITGLVGGIPSYNSNTWTQGAVDAGFDVVVGESKPLRYPNHGQQFYDHSNGAYGYDLNTGAPGASGMSETYGMSQQFIDYFRDIAGLRISAISYTNGAQAGSAILPPYFLGGRNSQTSTSGDSDIQYNGLTRAQAISKPSSTRTWDMANSSFPDQASSIAYTQGEIAKAIASGGWWNDFMHWHSLYNFDDVAFFDTFYSAIRSEIGSADVWTAGYNEVVEYYFLKNIIERVGSFENEGRVYVFAQVTDSYAGTDNAGIPYALPMDALNTPLSIRVDLTGTALAGQQITAIGGHSVRQVSGDVWIVNVPYTLSRDGYFGATLVAGTESQYNPATPVLTNNAGVVSSDLPCRFVVWRKADAAALETTEEINRVNDLGTVVTVEVESGYTYYVGGITESRHSSLIEI